MVSKHTYSFFDTCSFKRWSLIPHPFNVGYSPLCVSKEYSRAEVMMCDLQSLLKSYCCSHPTSPSACVCVCVCISASPSGIASSGELDCHVVILKNRVMGPYWGRNWGHPARTGTNLQLHEGAVWKVVLQPPTSPHMLQSWLTSWWPSHVRTTQLTHSQPLDHRNCEDNHCL